MKNPDVATFELHRKGEPRIFEKDGEMFYEQRVQDFPFEGLLINLTRMFGKGNEPETVEEFNKYFPQPQRYSVKISESLRRHYDKLH